VDGVFRVYKIHRHAYYIDDKEKESHRLRLADKHLLLTGDFEARLHASPGHLKVYANHQFVGHRTEKTNRKDVKSSKTCNEKLKKMRDLIRKFGGRGTRDAASVAFYRSTRACIGNFGRGGDA
jgi:hypothetical protein